MMFAWCGLMMLVAASPFALLFALPFLMYKAYRRYNGIVFIRRIMGLVAAQIGLFLIVGIFSIMIVPTISYCVTGKY